MKSFDLIVAGGGMVGAATACGLAMAGYSVAMLEPFTPQCFDPKSAPDLRVSAFSLASEALLRKLGAWEQIESMRLTPYTGLQTWEAGMDERVIFSADQIGQSHLGYMIENRLVQLALWQRCQALGVELFDWQDWQLHSQADSVTVTQGEQTLSARLLIGADGAASRVREQSGIGICGWQYRQHCLSVNIELDKPAPAVTWQEFHPSGPRALLPLAGNYAALIWYDTPAVIDSLASSNAAALKQRLLAAFAPLPGDFTPLQWGRFALTRRHAQRYWQQRVVLCGDSAHTIHPLAGQGVNIGFKDVALLLDVLKGRDLSANIERALNRYQHLRMADNLMMQSTMDLLYKTFSHPHSWVRRLRQSGLMLAERSGPLKRQALRYAVGL